MNMNYALIENGIVNNIIVLMPSNADEFPNAISIGDRRVGIGDSYIDGKFYRDGSEILTGEEEIQNLLKITLEEKEELVHGKI